MGYSINEPEFDMQKFSGRFNNFIKVSNPLHAFYSNRRIKEFQLLIKVQKRDEERYFKMTGTRKMIVPKEKVKLIRIAQTVISTAVNPDTGKNIFWSMRMSSFLPFNLPISFGLIITPPTPFNTILWQWINQTYNAQCNYGNRNASSEYTVKTVMRSYVAACVASISVALFTRMLVSGWTKSMTGGLLVIFNAFTAYLATSSAGFLNAFMMRVTELQKGISVFDPADPKKSVAVSKSAARKAVLQTATSRFILALPMIVPALALYGIERMGLMPASFIGSTLIQMILFTIELYFALPLGIAAYPPIGKIMANQFANDSDDVKNQIKNYRNSDGEALKYFEYNKGL